MKVTRIENSGDRGWFVGCFEGAAHQTELAEVCYKREPAGPVKPHYHTKCTETVFILRGKAVCQGSTFKDGDIFILEPGEINDLVYLEETETICVKTPAGGDDKIYI